MNMWCGICGTEKRPGKFNMNVSMFNVQTSPDYVELVLGHVLAILANAPGKKICPTKTSVVGSMS